MQEAECPFGWLCNWCMTSHRKACNQSGFCELFASAARLRGSLRRLSFEDRIDGQIDRG